VGLVLEACFDAGSWGAGYGGDVGRADRYYVAPAARALECGGCTSCGCVDTVCALSPRGRGPGPCFFGAPCAALPGWAIVKGELGYSGGDLRRTGHCRSKFT
jgi:hypothetical protein